MRIDRLLCNLRFTRTRGLAQKLVDSGHIRCNGARVMRHSHPVAIGDVLTLPLGSSVIIAQIVVLAERRGSALAAQACYRLLDPGSEGA